MPDEIVNDSDLDSALDEAMGSDEGSVEETPTEPQETETDQETVEEVPEPLAEPGQEEEKPEEEVEEPESLEPDELDEEIKPDRETEREMFFRKSKAQRLLKAHHDWNQLQEKIPGATLETLEKNYKHSVMWDRMIADYGSGDDDRMGQWSEFWFGKEVNPETVMETIGNVNLAVAKNHPEALNTMAQAFPVMLAKHNVQALGVLENTVNQALVNRLYREAQQTGDKGVLTLAQNLDYRLNKRFKNAEQLTQAAPQEQNQEYERFRRERDEFRAEQRRAAQDRAQAWLQETDSIADGEAKKAIDERVDKYKGNYAPAVFAAIKRDLLERVEKYAKNNPDWQQQYNAKRDQAYRQHSEESRNALAAMKRNVAELVLRKNLKQVLEEYTASAVKASAETRQRLADKQTRREASAGGKATSPGFDLRKAKADGSLSDLDKAFDLILP